MATITEDPTTADNRSTPEPIEADAKKKSDPTPYIVARITAEGIELVGGLEKPLRFIGSRDEVIKKAARTFAADKRKAYYNPIPQRSWQPRLYEVEVTEREKLS